MAIKDIINKAVNNGYDALSGAEYDSLKALSKGHRDIINKAVNNGYDAISDSEYNTLKAISSPAAQVKAQLDAPQAPVIQPEKSMVEQFTSGFGQGMQKLRNMTSLIPAAFTAATHGITDPSTTFDDVMKATDETYRKAQSGQGLPGVVASPINLASMTIPGVGQSVLARTAGNGLIQALVGGASEAESQSAQNPGAPFDLGKIGISSGISGALGAGIGLISSKLGEYGEKLAKGEAATKAKNLEILAANKAMEKDIQATAFNAKQAANKKVEDLYKSLMPGMKSVDKIETDWIEKTKLHNELGLPANLAPEMPDVLKARDEFIQEAADQARKIQQVKNAPFIKEPIKYTPPDFISGKSLLGGGIGGILGHDIGGGLGLTIGGGLGLTAPYAIKGITKAAKATAPHAGGILEAAKLSPYAGQYLGDKLNSYLR